MDTWRARGAAPSPRVATWRLHDILFAVARDQQLPRDVLRTVFEALPFTPEPARSTTPAFAIEVRLGPEPLPPVSAQGPSRISFGLRIDATRDGLVVSDGLSWFAVDLENGTGYLSLHPEFRTQPGKKQLSLFLVGFNELVADLGQFDLHGAAVATGDAGCLLIGPSGSGKSTAALAMVANGWAYVSDDALLLVDEKPVRARSFRQAFNVNPDLADHFPPIRNHFKGDLGEDGKRFLDASRAYPGRFRDECVLSRIAFTQLSSDDKTSLCEVKPAEALTRLIQQSPSLAFRRRHARRHLDVLRGLVQQTRSFLLTAGQDARENPDILHGHLAAVL